MKALSVRILFVVKTQKYINTKKKAVENTRNVQSITIHLIEYYLQEIYRGGSIHRYIK